MQLKLSDKQTRLLELVKKFHETQKRKYTFEPYYLHLISVATIASEFIKEQFVIEISLCHDLFEDTECTSLGLRLALLEIGYSLSETNFIVKNVHDLTDEFTKEKYPEINRKERKRREAERLSKISVVAQSVKYSDIIDNIPSIVEYDKDFAKTYLSEKINILDKMRGGDINLFIRCCSVYYKAVKEL